MFKKRETPSLNYDAYNKSWYFGFLSKWDDLLSQKKLDEELQEEYLYELSLRIRANTNNRNLKLLSQNEIKKFWQGVKNNLQYIDNIILIEKAVFFNAPLKKFLLDLKGPKLHTTYTTTDIVVKTDDGFTFTQASSRAIFIEMMSFDKKRNKLVIMGTTTFPFDHSTTSLTVIINGKKQELKDSGLYSDFKIFGEVVYHKFPFLIEKDLHNTDAFEISFSFNNPSTKTIVPLDMVFNTRMSKLAGRITYWRFSDYVATHKKHTLYIKPYRPYKVLVREFAFLLAIATIWRRPTVAALRASYWITKPFLARKNIWMFADKIYKAGDNAEWLYRYTVKQNDGVNAHYVLRPDSADVQQFKNDGIRYLKYKSLKQRMLFLHAKIIVFTHNNTPGYYRFGGPKEVFFRGLYNYDIMYIQHGLAVQDTSWLYKKSVDDFALFFVASKFETENLLRPAYGYRKSEIITAGATRYDGLVNNDKKNIIISPTWRTYLAPPGKDYGESRDANNLFKDSDFYKIYESLITNEKLIATAKELGYDITYLLHPVMSSQINDFKNDGYVKIVTANDDFNYQKAMTEASLMVTDYSGVQFDFAYMYKPVVYFHPPKLPASYDEALYKYEKHALGEIETDIDSLVKLICEYMENDCAIKPKYKKRIDEFFYHHDHENSKRTYDAIRDWQDKLANK